jgi:hypothetical protein
MDGLDDKAFSPSGESTGPVFSAKRVSDLSTVFMVQNQLIVNPAKTVQTGKRSMDGGPPLR